MSTVTIAPGMIPLPKRQAICKSAVEAPQKLEWGVKRPPPLAILNNNTGIISGRFSKIGLDLSFQLAAVQDSRIKEQHIIGRIWKPIYPAHYTFTNAPAMHEHTLVAASAYAGFRHGIADPAAMRSLAAVSATLGLGTEKTTIPDQARAALNRAFATNFQPERMMLRLAVLWAAASVAELCGNSLTIHDTQDAISPRPIRNLAEWGLAVTAAAKQMEQPILVNLRGSDEPQKFARIVRLACLPNITATTGLNGEPPSVLKMWPPVPHARTYVMAEFDQNQQLAGELSARDVAIIISYYARAWNFLDQTQQLLDVASWAALRPAGSGLYGTTPRCRVALPPSDMAQAVLLPLTQSVDSVDAEDLLPVFHRPAPQLVHGAAMAAVLLTATNCTLGASGIHLDSTLRPSIRKDIEAQYQQLSRQSIKGSALTHAALTIAADLGWTGSYPEYMAGIGLCGSIADHSLQAVEAEEAMPFITSFPDLCSTLGILQPSSMDSIVPYDIPLMPSVVKNRHNVSDAFYSMIAVGAEPKISYRTYAAGTLLGEAPYTTKLSYRGLPSDGQFISHTYECSHMVPTFSLGGLKQVTTAMNGASARSNWSWYYEWLIPFNSTDVIAQFITAPSPVSEYKPPVLPKETTVPITAPPIRTEFKPPKSVVITPADIEQWREELGDAFSNVHDAYITMKALVGKEVSESRYDQNVRLLTDSIVAVEAESLKYAVEPEEIPPLFTYFAQMAYDAEHWDRTPAMKANLHAVAGAYLDMALAEPFEEESCGPPSEEENKATPPDQPAIQATLHDGYQEALRATTASPLAQSDFGTPSGVAPEPEPSNTMTPQLQAVSTVTFTAPQPPA
jgi:hypothetical protein